MYESNLLDVTCDWDDCKCVSRHSQEVCVCVCVCVCVGGQSLLIFTS